MNSVLFDSIELISSTYNVSRVLDNTTPQRTINLIETEGVDGAVIVSDRFGAKTIDIKGILVGTSESDLQTKIDTANELFSRKGVNLDIIPDGGSARRYVVCLIGAVEYNRDFYNIDYVPFKLKLFVYEGVGKDTTTTTAISNLNTTLERDPASGSDTINFVGSADPKPNITFTLDTIGKLDLITINDDDSGEEMSIEIDGEYSATDEVVVDLANQTVKKNGVDVPFLGNIPTFLKGDNDLHITYQGATEILDAEQSTDHSGGTFVGNNGAGTIRLLAQKFVAENSGYLSALKIWAKKNGAPGTFYVDIYQDNGELPATIFGTAFSNPSSDFGTSSAEINLTINDLKYLRKGVTYWLVFRTGDTAGNYYILYGSGTTDYYPNGKLLKYDGTVTPPTDPNDWEDYSIADLYFKSYRGQGGAVNWFVDLVIKYTKRYL